MTTQKNELEDNDELLTTEDVFEYLESDIEEMNRLENRDYNDVIDAKIKEMFPVISSMNENN